MNSNVWIIWLYLVIHIIIVNVNCSPNDNNNALCDTSLSIIKNTKTSQIVHSTESCTANIVNKAITDETIIMLENYFSYPNHEIISTFSIDSGISAGSASLLFGISNIALDSFTGFEISLSTNGIIELNYHSSSFETKLLTTIFNYIPQKTYTLRVTMLQYVYIYLNNNLITAKPYDLSLIKPNNYELTGLTGFKTSSTISFSLYSINIINEIRRRLTAYDLSMPMQTINLFCKMEDWAFSGFGSTALINPCGFELKPVCKGDKGPILLGTYNETKIKYMNYWLRLTIYLKDSSCCSKEDPPTKLHTSCTYGVRFQVNNDKYYEVLLDFGDKVKYMIIRKHNGDQQYTTFFNTSCNQNYSLPFCVDKHAMIMNTSIIIIENIISVFFDTRLITTIYDCDMPLYSGTIGIQSGWDAAIEYQMLEMIELQDNYLCNTYIWSVINGSSFYEFNPCTITIPKTHKETENIILWIGERAMESLAWSDIYVKLTIQSDIFVKQSGFIFRVFNNNTFYMATINNKTFYLYQNSKESGRMQIMSRNIKEMCVVCIIELYAVENKLQFIVNDVQFNETLSLNKNLILKGSVGIYSETTTNVAFS
eukprot:212892_1